MLSEICIDFSFKSFDFTKPFKGLGRVFNPTIQSPTHTFNLRQNNLFEGSNVPYSA